MTVAGAASATQYCVNLSSGSDSNNGLMSTNTCWSTINAVTAFSSSFQPGDVVLLCRGDDHYQSQLSITSAIGTLSSPVVFSSYDCRDTSSGANIFPLPRISTASQLPQTGGQLVWTPTSVTTPTGATVQALAYNLTALEQITGSTFLPADRFSAASMIDGLWVNGVEYHSARFPDRVNPLDGRGQNIQEFLFLDSTRVSNNLGGYWPRSTSASLQLSPSTWPFLYFNLYGANSTAWCNDASIDGYYTDAFLNIRTGASAIERVVIPEYTASTIDPNDFVDFLSCSLDLLSNVACTPSTLNMSDPMVHSITLPEGVAVNFTAQPFWQTTSIPAPASGAWAGDMLFNRDWFTTAQGPTTYGGFTTGFFLSDHPDFLNAPGEYFYDTCTDMLYIVPLTTADYNMLTSTSSSTPLTAAGVASAYVDHSLMVAPVVVQFSSESADGAAIEIEGVGANVQLTQLQVAYVGQAVSAVDYTSLSLYNMQIYNTLDDGIDASSINHVPTNTVIFNVSMWNVGGSAILAAGSHSVWVENVTLSNSSLVWRPSVQSAAISVSASTSGTVRNNIVENVGAGAISAQGQGPVLVELNSVYMSNQLHPSGAAITSNAVAQWNIGEEIVLNTINGIPQQLIPNQGLVSGIAAGAYTTMIQNNLMSNVSGPCTSNINAGSLLQFSNNTCIESGVNLGPYPTTMTANQYGYNTFLFTSPTLADTTELLVTDDAFNTHQPSFSTHGRQLDYGSTPVMNYLTNTLVCVGLVEQQLSGGFNTTQYTAALGSSYLLTLANAIAYLLTFTQQTTNVFEYGLANCGGGDSLVAWNNSRYIYQVSSEAAFQTSIMAATPNAMATPLWPWPTVDGSVPSGTYEAGSSSSNGALIGALAGTGGGVAALVLAGLAAKKKKAATTTGTTVQTSPWTNQATTPVVGAPQRPDIEMASL